MNTLEFPALGLELEINRVAFQIGSLKIYWYGIIIAVGFMLALIYALKRSRSFGVIADKILDVAIFGVVGGVIGARLYYVAFSWDTFAGDFWKIFRIWEGGIAIYGGIIGALLTGSLACKLLKVKLFPMYDLAAMGFLLGQGIGRWGNFVNVEAYGAPMETPMPWGMTSSKIISELTLKGFEVTADTVVHPCFLYESLWCLLGFVVLHFISKHRRFDGQISLLYLLWYGAERFVVEGLRTDSLWIGNFRISQIVAIVCVIAAATALIIIGIKCKRKNDPEYLKCYAKTTEWEEAYAAYQEQIKESKEKKHKKSHGEKPFESVVGGELIVDEASQVVQSEEQAPDSEELVESESAPEATSDEAESETTKATEE